MTNTNPKIENLKDKTFIINLTVTLPEIESEKDVVIASFAANYEGKGFRKGKAPVDVVKSQIAPEKLLEEIINSLLPKKYSQIIKDNNLKPVTNPIVKINNPPFTLDKEWQIEITGAQIPDIKIDPKAFAEIKEINKKTDLEKNKKTDEALKALLKNTALELSKVIIDNDVNKKLTDLVEQTQQAGISVEDFLKNKNLTLDQYRHEMEHRIIEEWTINLAINQISLDQKIEPDQAEVESIIKSNPKLAQNPDLIFYLLTQQKVIDYLLGL
jgi:FKBP-type peptidyl-prolyl cis-trans isomerase (trigger factor)